jgi:tetratricopeptide (TPR) repeat protein
VADRDATPSPDAVDAAVAAGDAQAAMRAAEDLVRAGPFASSAAAIERAIERFPRAAHLATLLLELHLRFRDWQGFDAAFRRFVERFPTRGELHFVAGKAFQERGKPCAAIRAYGRAARLDPDDLDSVARVAHVFRDEGRPYLARRGLRRALARHPDAANLHAAMGYSYVEDGQAPKAAACFYKAVALDPVESPYLDELGVALLVAERWRDAASIAVRSLRAHPEREKAWTVYAVAHRRLGHARQAEQGYRSAVRFASDPSRARGNLGLFLASRPEAVAEAREHLRAALDEHPEWDAVREALEGL